MFTSSLLKHILFYFMIAQRSQIQNSYHISSVKSHGLISVICNFQCCPTPYFNLIMLVTCSFMSKTSTIAIPDNSYTNGASITTIFCTFGGNTVFSFGKKGTDLFRKLKQESHESITLPNSNTYLIPKSKSIFS